MYLISGGKKKGSDIDRVAATASRMADWAKHAIRRAFRDHEAQNNTSSVNNDNKGSISTNSSSSSSSSANNNMTDVDAQFIAQLIHDDHGNDDINGNMSSSSSGNTSSSSRNDYSSNDSKISNDGISISSLKSSTIQSVLKISAQTAIVPPTVTSTSTTSPTTTNDTKIITSYEDSTGTMKRNDLSGTQQTIFSRTNQNDKNGNENDVTDQDDINDLPVKSSNLGDISRFLEDGKESITTSTIFTKSASIESTSPTLSPSLSTTLTPLSPTSLSLPPTISSLPSTVSSFLPPTISSLPHTSTPLPPTPSSLPPTAVCKVSSIAKEPSIVAKSSDFNDLNSLVSNSVPSKVESPSLSFVNDNNIESMDNNIDESVCDRAAPSDTSSYDFSPKTLQISEINDFTSKSTTSGNGDDIGNDDDISIIKEDLDEFPDSKIEKDFSRNNDGLSHINLIPDTFNDNMGENCLYRSVNNVDSVNVNNVDTSVSVKNLDSSVNNVDSVNVSGVSMNNLHTSMVSNFDSSARVDKISSVNNNDINVNNNANNVDKRVSDNNVDSVSDSVSRSNINKNYISQPDGYTDLTEEDVDAFEKYKENDLNDQIVGVINKEIEPEPSGEELRRLLREEQAEEGQARRVRNAAARDAESMTEEMKVQYRLFISVY